MRNVIFVILSALLLQCCARRGEVADGGQTEPSDSLAIVPDSLKEVIDAWQEYSNLLNIHSENYIITDYQNISKVRNLELDMDEDGYLETVSISKDAQKGNVRINAFKGSYVFNLIDFVGLESTIPSDSLTQYQVSATDLDGDGRVEVVLAIGRCNSEVKGAIFRTGRYPRSFYQFLGRFTSEGNLVQKENSLLFRKKDGSVMAWNLNGPDLVLEPY